MVLGENIHNSRSNLARYYLVTKREIVDLLNLFGNVRRGKS